MSLQVQITAIQGLDAGALGVSFNIIPSGSYVTGGDTLDFTKAIADPAFQGLLAQIISSQGPISLSVWDAGGLLANTPAAILGTTLANSKVKFLGSAFNTELAACAYPGAITGSKQQGYAIFPKLL